MVVRGRVMRVEDDDFAVIGDGDVVIALLVPGQGAHAAGGNVRGIPLQFLRVMLNGVLVKDDVGCGCPPRHASCFQPEPLAVRFLDGVNAVDAVVVHHAITDFQGRVILCDDLMSDPILILTEDCRAWCKDQDREKERAHGSPWIEKWNREILV